MSESTYNKNIMDDQTYSADAQQRAEKLEKTFQTWEQKIPKASEEKLHQFINYTQGEINNRKQKPQEFAGIVDRLEEVQAKARAMLGKKGLSELEEYLLQAVKQQNQIAKADTLTDISQTVHAWENLKLQTEDKKEQVKLQALIDSGNKMIKENSN